MAGADLKTGQELLCHANSRITLDIYTRTISATKREANIKVVEMVIEAGKGSISAPSQRGLFEYRRQQKRCRKLSAPFSTLASQKLILSLYHKPLIYLGFMAGTTGLEPATSAVTGQRSNQLSYVPNKHRLSQNSPSLEEGMTALRCQ